MDRNWLLTSSFYATWLPGERRGFVGRVRDRRDGEAQSHVRQEHDAVGSAYDRDIAGLRRSALELMKGPPIHIVAVQAQVLRAQFSETCRYRGWQLRASAVMHDHCHWVVGVPGDPDPENLLRDLKAYGSRALNKRWPKPASGTWWTESGSRRVLKSARRLSAAVVYVAFKQPNPLAVYLDPTFPIPAKHLEQAKILGERGA